MSEVNIIQIIGQCVYVVKNCYPVQFERFIRSYFAENPLLLYQQDKDKVYFTLYLSDIALQSFKFPSDNPSQCITQFTDCAVLLARLQTDALHL